MKIKIKRREINRNDVEEIMGKKARKCIISGGELILIFDDDTEFKATSLDKTKIDKIRKKSETGTVIVEVEE